MYLNKMNEEQIGEFLDKFNYRELLELSKWFNIYNKDHEDDRAVNFEKRLNLRIETMDKEWSGELNLYEVKDMLNKFNFGELSTITWLLEDIKTTSISQGNKYLVARSLLQERRKIVMIKNIENLDLEEVEYYLNNISSNSKEWYAIDAHSKNEEITKEEFYNYYKNQDVRRILVRYR